MDIDLPAILLWVVLVLGVIWLIDKLVLKNRDLLKTRTPKILNLLNTQKLFPGFISGFGHQEFYWRALPNPI